MDKSLALYIARTMAVEGLGISGDSSEYRTMEIVPTLGDYICFSVPAALDNESARKLALYNALVTIM